MERTCRLAKVIDVLENALVVVAQLAMAAIMLVVVLDVTMRYGFNRPLVWSYGLISLYLMVALFFFGLSHTLRHDGHVAIDVFVGLIPKPLRHLIDGLGYGTAGLLFGAGAWLAAGETVTGYLNDELMAGAVAWPTWVAQLIVALGLGVFALRCAQRSLCHLASFATGRPLIDFPHAAVEEMGE